MSCAFFVVFAVVLVLCGFGSGQRLPQQPDPALNLSPLDIGVTCAEYPRTPMVRTFVVDQPDADIILLHFDFLNLMAQDTLVLRAVVNHTVGAVIDTIRSTSRAPLFSVPLYTPLVVLELHVVGETSRPDGACYGFHVNGVRTSAVDGNKATFAGESICGTDEARNSQCFVSSGMYTASRAVVRLLTNRVGASAFCTGWLLGCEGHLLTNEHCIQNAMDAANTLIEFMAEGVSCSTNCNSQLACGASPRLFTRGATFIAASKDLDYAIVKLDPAVIPDGLGFLRLRLSGPRLNEQVYIPQHPLGWGKQVATMAGREPGTITTLTLAGCSVDQAGYMLDTQPGSSGSPVMSVRDNTVVALHHCGGCPNGGIQSQKLIQDFARRGILPQCSIA